MPKELGEWCRSCRVFLKVGECSGETKETEKGEGSNVTAMRCELLFTSSPLPAEVSWIQSVSRREI